MKTKDKEIAMFGETIEEMKGMKHEFTSDTMHAMMILSDAQHVLKSDPELARQLINKAKYFLRNQLQKESQNDNNQSLKKQS